MGYFFMPERGGRMAAANSTNDSKEERTGKPFEREKRKPEGGLKFRRMCGDMFNRHACRCRAAD